MIGEYENLIFTLDMYGKWSVLKGDTTSNCSKLVHQGTRGKQCVHFQLCQRNRRRKTATPL